MEADPVSAGTSAGGNSAVVQTWHGGEALAKLPSLEPLLHRTRAPVTARPEWLIAAAAREVGRDPLLVTVTRNGVVVAAACLSVRRIRAAASFQLLGAGRADHARLPALDLEAAQALSEAIVGVLSEQRLWRVRLDQLPPNDPVGVSLSQRLGLRQEPGVGCPLTVVDHDAGFASTLSVNGRKSLRRGNNRLVVDGHQPAVFWDTGDAVVRALPAVQALRRDRDHALGRASEMDDAAAAGFHTDVVTALARDGRLELLRYEVDGVLAAYALVIIDAVDGGHVLRVWDGRVAPGYDRYGIGWLADVVVLERAHADRSVLAVDWMRGEQENKQRSSTAVVDSVVLLGESTPWLTKWDGLTGRLEDSLLAAARRVVPPERRHRWRARVTRA